MRSLFISLSHRRSLARLAVRSPLTRPVVARFVAGETLEEALPALAELKRAGLRTTVDVLGESVTSADAGVGRGRSLPRDSRRSRRPRAWTPTSASS